MKESIFRNLRGVRKLMLATLTTDNDTTLAYDTPVRFAGVREIGGEEEESSGTEYYDNQASIVISAEWADTYSVTTSVLDDGNQSKNRRKKSRYRKRYLLRYSKKQTIRSSWFYW